ncbi:MAG: hypothetical protein K6V36_10795 [Anaerolineae bacterium]|nr:hypothetical protein [Anaerolineae bacterium]
MSSETGGTVHGAPAAGERRAASGTEEQALAGRQAGLLARVQAAYDAHPRLLTWAVLAIGMVPILLWASRDVSLLLHQRLVLVAATIGLAGLCAWIIGWEGD